MLGKSGSITLTQGHSKGGAFTCRCLLEEKQKFEAENQYQTPQNREFRGRGLNVELARVCFTTCRRHVVIGAVAIFAPNP